MGGTGGRSSCFLLLLLMAGLLFLMPSFPAMSRIVVGVVSIEAHPGVNVLAIHLLSGSGRNVSFARRECAQYYVSLFPAIER